MKHLSTNCAFLMLVILVGGFLAGCKTQPSGNPVYPATLSRFFSDGMVYSVINP